MSSYESFNELMKSTLYLAMSSLFVDSACTVLIFNRLKRVSFSFILNTVMDSSYATRKLKKRKFVFALQKVWRKH